MDAQTYKQLQEDICKTCPNCARKLAALDVLFDKAPTIVPEKTLSMPDDANGASDQRTCALCPNRIRSDNSGCPKCQRKVCRQCRRPSGSSKSGYCLECAPFVPDERVGNGGARPNSGPKPRGPADEISNDEAVRRGTYLSAIEKELCTGGLPFQLAEKYQVDRKWVVSLQTKLTRNGRRSEA